MATQLHTAVKDPDRVSFMAAQITIAKGYLDRSSRATRETSSRYAHYARQVHQDLSVLRERLRVRDRCTTASMDCAAA